MYCLYSSDYGPANPAFDPLADGGRLMQGFEAHLSELAKAQNLGQLEAMERQLQRGQDIVWCEQGYSWVQGWAVDGFLACFFVLVVLPYAAKRLTPRLLRAAVATLQWWAAICGTGTTKPTSRTAYPGGL
jgi:hypothetical protein